MKDCDKTRQQLLDELAERRRLVVAAQAEKAGWGSRDECLNESGRCCRSFLRDFKGLVFRGQFGYRPTLLAGAVEEITGYSADEFLTGAVRVDSIIHPDDLLGLRGTQDQIRTVPDYSTEREYRIVRKDGQVRWVREVVHNVCDEQGAPVGAQGFLYDITPLKQAELALLEREQRARLIIETARLGIHECDTEGRITFTNRSEGDLLGYTAEELLGTCVWDHLEPGPAKDALPAYLKQLAAEQPPPSPYFARRLRKDGEACDVRVDWNYKRDAQGRVVGFVSVVTDITEQKKAEAAIRESEQRYRTLAESTTDVVYIVDPEGTLLYANRTAAQYIGISPTALQGKGQKDLFPPEMAKRHKERLRRVVETGEPGEMDELFRFGSQEVWLNVRSVPIRDEQGRVTAIMGVCRNITERKRAEEALQRAHEELERRVEERTAELAWEKKTLKHLLQSSDHERQLIAYEIHDGLAQHLAGAVMQFEGFHHLKETKPRQAADAYHAGITMLRQAHSEARRLISGVRPPILDEAGIVAAVSHLVNEVRRRKGPKIEYASDVEFDRLTPILENAIYRIVQEALNNACRHSKSDRIRVEVVQHGDRIHVEVQDWGVGFRPDNIEDSHFGVAGMRERSRLLGGSAVIDSRPGEGTRVVVEIPIVLGDTE